MNSACTNEDTGRLIALYELNQLSETERRRFEDHLMECPFCFQEVQELQPVICTLREKQAEIVKGLAEEGVSLAQEKRALRESYRRQNKSSILEVVSAKIEPFLEAFRRPLVWAPALAAVALILIIVLPLSRTPNPYLPLLDRTPPKITLITFRSPTAPSPGAAQQFEAGLEAYSANNLPGAIKHFQKAVELAPELETNWLYLGITHYLTGHPRPAITSLNKALALPDLTLRDQARWYLAQAYLLNNEAEKALPLLRESIQQGGEFAVRSDSLLMRIGTIK